jgi:gliding motility-associated-like protein
VDIIEYDEVTAEIVYDDGFCPGDEVTFTVLTNGLNNQYDFYWLINDNFEGQGSTFTFPITDTVDVMINLVNTGNCPTVKDTTTVGPIFMQPNSLSVIGTPDTICFGSLAMIQGVVDNMDYISSIWWNDTSLIGEGPHAVFPDQATEYICILENICGEQQSAATLINVFLPPVAAIFANGSSGCDRIDVGFGYNFVSTDHTLQGVTWTINGQQYDMPDPSLTYTYSASVPATAHLTFSNGCTFDYSDELIVEVFESPQAEFYFNPDPAIQHEVTEFVDISHGNPNIWEWYLEGEYISDEERPSHIFDQTGEYWVQQIIFNENGCSDTMEHLLEVIGSFTVYVPNAFTPDGNSFNNTFKPVMFDVVPDNYEFLIFNRWGEIIFRTENLDGNWNGSFQGESVADGVYIWKVLVTDNVGLAHEYIGNVTLLR